MSNELENAFAALSRDASRGRLLPAAEVRHQSDRRAVRRGVLTVTAAAVVIAGAFGTGWALGGDDHGQRLILPAVSPSPSPALPSPAPSVLPSPPAKPVSTPPSTVSRTSSPPPALPKSIPARAMLSKADGEFSRLTEIWDPTRLCGEARFPSAAVRASVRVVYKRPGLGAEHVPDDVVYNTVSVYRGSGAEDFLDELRDAVRRCPTGGEGTPPPKYRSLGSPGLGEESLMIERSAVGRTGTGEPDPNAEPQLTYIVAIRSGDAVTLLDTTGWENFSSIRSSVDTLAETAADRLTAWRP
ncbi:hypothetical protein [Paractinoplanes atraurantiacus]|uniref:PknH-like extracellular domain-containing protein n=1 Tax=Paractinoplanes atraurantiacus TaxID=1036182 RepID=A0A285KMT5_9ACTN|nr:hypothetical protein [Actinoplanes atraurantiacus]SNY73952.1 hypothetical protein SAMN05421748_14937 [Actinoplanes atraurantiacus]